ncbi:tRNA preQ1(34) S-adenosylmethionine ribosyltransferase-isomerase QueA [Candidatus Woesearchaeota archaeon]|nr:tRNA preQ1(34) S-adenosylmethionine ribosyltransferase-isomerase QueA [Candidatus Woesearchaeota archaeon]
MDQINLESYNYVLPREHIAQEAMHPRDHCKLLVLHEDGKIEDKHFYNIVDYLQPGDVLVLNETKVQHCKLIATKKTGGNVEIILTKRIAPCAYESRIKGSNLHPGVIILTANNRAYISKQKDDVFTLFFDNELAPEDILLLTPPYIKQTVPEEDYQTVFAKKEGSLAAPTAGLHFTQELLEKIKHKGIKIAKVRLDISFETFLPVRDIHNHKTGKEYFELDQENADIINSGRIIAVGTTTVKCLESCQWHNGKVLPTTGDSQIFITPGHQFNAPIKAMITNFHLPKSSLLLLTSAFVAWEKLLPAYEHAVKENYRFYSLGDAMMLWRQQ